MNEEKCVTCNGELSFDRIAKCKVCRACHPVKPLPMPPVSFSMIGLEYCDTEKERTKRIEEVARANGWNPEKHIHEENIRRFGND
jgi:reverse gyrase